MSIMETQVQQRPTVARQMFTARVSRSVLLSPQTKHLELSVEGVEEFRFVPGQFVSIKQPRPDGKEHTRAYSIASPPRQNPTFDLCLNRVEEGFLSNWLCDLPEGASVQFHGPHGLFTLREPRTDAVFIASSCYRRQPELDSAWRRDSFVKILEETRRKYRFVVYRFFHHIFSVPRSQTCTTIGAMIHRRCSIEKCARLQRWTYFRLRIF